MKWKFGIRSLMNLEEKEEVERPEGSLREDLEGNTVGFLKEYCLKFEEVELLKLESTIKNTRNYNKLLKCARNHTRSN
jgi:hypothetical protein